MILARFLPFLGWFSDYSKDKLRSDIIGGLTVAMVLIPQSMAYAQLAGLPPYYGLYAAFLPPLVASLFGSSYQLATGPVAVVSLMTNTALAPLATAGSDMFIAYAILLALIVGAFQFTLGALKLGLVVNFLSHPVVNGFTNAAAIIIATSQLSKLFGVYVDKGHHHYETIYNVIISAFNYTHLPTLGMAVVSFAIMIGMKKLNPRLPNVLMAVAVTTVLSALVGFSNDFYADISEIKSDEIVSVIEEFNESVRLGNEKSEQRFLLREELDRTKEQHGTNTVEYLLLFNKIAILNVEIEDLRENQHELRYELRNSHFNAVDTGEGKLSFYLAGNAPPGSKIKGKIWRIKVGYSELNTERIKMMGGGAVIGEIPAELPKFKIPKIDFKIILTLLPMAVIISILGFMEAISIAKAMAAKTGQRLDPNQELIGQGLSNIVGSCFSSYAVSGSFSRSAVNLQAGAATGLSNVISSIVVGLTLLFFTPLLYHLPQAVLASIIMMAVIGLVNVSGFVHAWQVQKYDGAISIITCLTTLYFAPHLDRGLMIGVGLSIGLYLLRNMKPAVHVLAKFDDGSFRDAETHGLGECRHIAVMRFSGPMFFANVSFFEDTILEEVAEKPDLRHILIVGNGITEVDASGEEFLSIMIDRLRESGYDVSFSGLNESVLATFSRTHLLEKIGEDHIYRNVATALEHIHEEAHRDSDEKKCPLKEVFPVSFVADRMTRVLIVDDEEDFVSLLSKRMKKRNVRVFTAKSGEEALEKTLSTEMDVVLLDINMPGIDGIEVLRQMKERDESMQVIFVTGKATIQVSVEAMKLGAFDIVQKPVELDSLMEKIKLAKIEHMKLRQNLSMQAAEQILRKSGW